MPLDGTKIDITLRDAMPAAPPGVAEQWEPFLEEAMQACEINTPQRMAGFLASIANETGQLQRFEELGWFGTPHERAAEMFGIACPPRDQYEGRKATMGRQAWNEWFFNWVYDDAHRGGADLGNDMPGDGWKYRGQGPGQITGKRNARRIFKRMGMPEDSDPALFTQPQYGALSFAVYWLDAGNNERLDRGDVQGAMKVMNSRLRDFSNHLAQYRRILQVMLATPKLPPATMTQAVGQAVTGKTGAAAAISAATAGVTLADATSKIGEAQITATAAKGFLATLGLPTPYTEIVLSVLTLGLIAFVLWRYGRKLLRGEAVST